MENEKGHEAIIYNNLSEARAEYKEVKRRVLTFDPAVELSIEPFLRMIEEKGSRLPDRLKGDIVLENVKNPSVCYNDIRDYASKHNTDDWKAFKAFLQKEYGDSVADEKAYQILADPLVYKGLDMTVAFQKLKKSLEIVKSEGLRVKGVERFISQLPEKLSVKIYRYVTLGEDVDDSVLSKIKKQLSEYQENAGTTVILGEKSTPKAAPKAEEERDADVHAVRAYPDTRGNCWTCDSPRHHRRDCPRERGRDGNRGGYRGNRARGGYRGHGRDNWKPANISCTQDDYDERDEAKGKAGNSDFTGQM